MAFKVSTSICGNIFKTFGQRFTIRNTSSYKWYQYLREPQPSDITNVYGGETVITPPKPSLTEVEESRDPKEWKFVEELLPRTVVPQPPKHESYPTPSGWFPPLDPVPGEMYRVRRTRFHNFPLYRVVLNGGRSPFTVIRYIEGDIKQLEKDVQDFLSERKGRTVYTVANEVCCKLWIKGTHMEDMSEFLAMKGF